MKNFKTERNWSDLDKSSKIAIAVTAVVWLMFVYGFCKNYNNQTQNNVVKSEMVRSR